MADVQTCCIRLFKKSYGFKIIYISPKGLQCVSELNDDEIDLIHLRSEINLYEFKDICFHYSYYFLKKFEKY